ncbi:hypothetical protein CXG81DRAFT_3544, partial [Caulochytrium protostelioides]
GTSIDQDGRFADKDAKLRASTAFPKCFRTPVDLEKVNLPLIYQWCSKQLAALLPYEDEMIQGIVAENLDQQRQQRRADPEAIYLQLAGFLGSHTTSFMRDLWQMLVDAQSAIGGIPPQILAAEQRAIDAHATQHRAVVADLASARDRQRMPRPDALGQD